MTDVDPAVGLIAHTGVEAPPQGATVVLLNPAGGTVTALGLERVRREVTAAFAAAGEAVEIETLPGPEIAAAARRWLTQMALPPRALVAAGGDGTVSTVAGLLAGSEVAL